MFLPLLVWGAKSVVVFPFENNTKNPGMEWMGESFVETLNDQFAASLLQPIGMEQRNNAYDLMGLPFSGDFSLATEIKVGEELDASYIVVGDFYYENQVLSASLQVIDVEQSKLEASFTEKGKLEDLKKIQSHLAWRVLTHFDRSFPYSQDDFVKRLPAVPLSAFENYVRGRRALDRQAQLQYYLKAERILPTYSKAIFQIGKIYFQDKDYSTSQLWLRRIGRTDPHYYEATFFLGLDNYFLKQYDKAAAAFTMLSTEIPLNEVFNNLAIALSHTGSSKAVVDYFQKAISGDPGEPDFYFNLGFYYWQSHDGATAAKYFREALVLNPGDAEASYLLARCLQSANQNEESARYLHQAARLNPKTASWTASSLPPMERIKLNYDAASFRELKAALDDLNEQKYRQMPLAAHVTEHLNRGKRFFEEFDNDDAITEFRHALELNPGLSEARVYLGRVYERQGDFDQAVRELKAALQNRPSADAHVALAHIYFTLDRKAEAEQEIAAALALDPRHTGAIEMQAVLRQNSSTMKK